MKVKELIELLKKENKNADVLVWIANEKGWALTKLGFGDAIIGHMTEDYPCKNTFVLIPVDIDVKLEDWSDNAPDEESMAFYKDVN